MGSMDRSVSQFVKEMKLKKHAILFYSDAVGKRTVLFSYLQAGLHCGEAAAYITSQESPIRIKRAMRSFGIDVDRFEESGALRVINSKDARDTSAMRDPWKSIYDDVSINGFKSLRVAWETAGFFWKKMTDELAEYEQLLHTIQLPVAAVCAYDSDAIGLDEEFYLDQMKTHDTVFFAGQEIGVVASY
jgi:hypothetical protein